MINIVKGSVYPLDKVLKIQHFRGFIVECRFDFDMDPVKIDLGAKRILDVYSRKVFLILVNHKEILIYRLEGESINLRKFITDLDLKCCIKTDYPKYKGAWKHAVGSGPNIDYQGIFSENGYCIQEKFWCDCWEYNFNLKFLYPGWFRLEGKKISSFSADLILTDIMQKASPQIARAITYPVDTTLAGMLTSLKDKGLEDVVPDVLVGEFEEK